MGLKNDVRLDGYANMLTKVGTARDSTEAYVYEFETPTPDVELAQIYSTNGLFARIIDKPAELVFKYGYDLGMGDAELEDKINKKLEALKWKTNGSTALKWARLFGGSAILMGIDDGGDWDDPVNPDAVRGVQSLVTFERPELQADYASILDRAIEPDGMSSFGMPEYYLVTPIYGGSQIRVHESRILIFRNGQLPRTSLMSSEYMFFGSPEYNRIKRELRETITTHENGYRLLERCVQAVYKMNNLSTILGTEDGEENVIKRMQLIDMSRSLLNTMVIDGDGEDFQFQNFTLPGVRDIIDESCNMLSAVTNIPQTVLFGRSPAGENATGESDLTNYYDYVGLIQEMNVTDNLNRLVKLILKSYLNSGEIEEVPEFELTANPLWNMSDMELAQLDQAKAQAAATKAQTAATYVDMQVLDPAEVRQSLARSDDFQIDEVLTEDDLLSEEEIEQIEQRISKKQSEQIPETESQATIGEAEGDITEKSASKENRYDADSTGDTLKGVGVYVVKDGKFLCGTRTDNGQLCGPGGCIKEGETAEAAAIRETMEEFGIEPVKMHRLGKVIGDKFLPSTIFLCTEFQGDSPTESDEMVHPEWLTIEEIYFRPCHPAFKSGIELVMETIIPLMDVEDLGEMYGEG